MALRHSVNILHSKGRTKKPENNYVSSSVVKIMMKKVDSENIER